MIHPSDCSCTRSCCLVHALVSDGETTPGLGMLGRPFKPHTNFKNQWPLSADPKLQALLQRACMAFGALCIPPFLGTTTTHAWKVCQSSAWRCDEALLTVNARGRG